MPSAPERASPKQGVTMEVHHSGALGARLVRIGAAGVIGGIIVLVSATVATPTPAGAVQDVCFGPVLPGSIPGIEWQTFDTLNTLGAPVDVNFSSVQAGLDGQTESLYSPICINTQIA
jgi:hypothetical protein